MLAYLRAPSLLPLLLLLLLLLRVDSSFPDVLAPIGTYNVTVCRNVTTAVPSSNATTNPVGVAQEAGTRAQQNVTNLLANSTWTNQAAQVFPAVRTAMTNLTSNASNLNGSYSIFSSIAQAAETAVNRSRTAGSASGRRLMQATTSGRPEFANASSGNAVGSQAGVTVFAPSDKAIQTYLQQQGLTQQQFLSNQPALMQLVSYHIVPTEALSAQNLASRTNSRLQTLLTNNTLGVMNFGFDVAGNRSQVVLLQDAMGTANVRDPNMATGKVSTCEDLLLRSFCDVGGGGGYGPTSEEVYLAVQELS
jgi:uncharacterized surface protein with fasciclin (FAS1) repeats